MTREVRSEKIVAQTRLWVQLCSRKTAWKSLQLFSHYLPFCHRTQNRRYEQKFTKLNFQNHQSSVKVSTDAKDIEDIQIGFFSQINENNDFSNGFIHPLITEIRLKLFINMICAEMENLKIFQMECYSN